MPFALLMPFNIFIVRAELTFFLSTTWFQRMLAKFENFKAPFLAAKKTVKRNISEFIHPSHVSQIQLTYHIWPSSLILNYITFCLVTPCYSLVWQWRIISHCCDLRCLFCLVLVTWSHLSSPLITISHHIKYTIYILFTHFITSYWRS